jgi:hypothetical protein
MLSKMIRESKAIEWALATIQRSLDRLTASGHTSAAFDIARAQFTASIRASWPSNLPAVAAAVDRALADGGLSLPEGECEQLRRAADVLRQVEQP